MRFIHDCLETEKDQPWQSNNPSFQDGSTQEGVSRRKFQSELQTNAEAIVESKDQETAGLQ